MDLLLGLVVMAVGVVTLVKKEIKLSDSRIARGRPARLAGLLLILALPVALVAQLAMGAAASSGHPILGEAARGVSTYFIILAVAVIALFVAFRGTRNPA